MNGYVDWITLGYLAALIAVLVGVAIVYAAVRLGALADAAEPPEDTNGLGEFGPSMARFGYVQARRNGDAE